MKNKGITLIALVVTIIVLLILAGVSIKLVLGNDGIITKARESRENTVVGQEKEQVELAYVSAAVNKLGDSVTDIDLQTELNSSVGNGKTKVTGSKILSVHFYETNHNYTVNNGTVTKATDGENNNVNVNGLKEVGVPGGEYAYVLKDTGDLVKFYYYDKAGGDKPEFGEYVKYDDKFETKIASGVKEVDEFGSYLTTTNDLCLYNEEEGTSQTIASGVKEFDDGLYLTTTNDLYKYNREASQKIASGVKEFQNGFGGIYYLTTTNDLCEYDRWNGTKKTVASGVKEFYAFGDIYYLTTTNDLCLYNEKEGTSQTIASGVKDFNNEGYYLTTTNDLYKYTREASQKIASEVKEFVCNGYYLTTTNDLYKYNGEASQKIASEVKEFDDGLYLTTTNDLCLYNEEEGRSITIASGVTRCGFKWYELNGGDVYILYERGVS